MTHDDTLVHVLAGRFGRDLSGIKERWRERSNRSLIEEVEARTYGDLKKGLVAILRSAPDHDPEYNIPSQQEEERQGVSTFGAAYNAGMQYNANSAAYAMNYGYPGMMAPPPPPNPYGMAGGGGYQMMGPTLLPSTTTTPRELYKPRPRPASRRPIRQRRLHTTADAAEHAADAVWLPTAAGTGATTPIQSVWPSDRSVWCGTAAAANAAGRVLAGAVRCGRDGGR